MTPHLPVIQRCAECGAEWVTSHICPMRSSVTSAPILPPKFTLPSFPECPYCHGHHGGRYACDELLEAAAAASRPPTPEER